MDMSSRLDVVFGTARVNAHELTPAEMAEIVKQAIETNKLHLKYFPGFKELHKYLNGPAGVLWRETPMPVIRTSGGLMSIQKTLCASLCMLTYESSGPLEGSWFRDLTESQLLLARDSKLILWEGRYRRYAEKMHGDSMVEIAEYSNLTWADKKKLQSILFPKAVIEILNTFNSLANDGIDHVNVRRASLEHAASQVRNIRERLYLS